MRSAWIAAAAFFSAAVAAADVTGSADLERLPRFAQAQIVDYRQTQVQERVYPQDSLHEWVNTRSLPSSTHSIVE